MEIEIDLSRNLEYLENLQTLFTFTKLNIIGHRILSPGHFLYLMYDIVVFQIFKAVSI